MDNRNLMRNYILFILAFFFSLQRGYAQQTSAEIYSQIKQLEVLGSVLYIAAHPDDENNSFLPYLTKERNFRTAYLSLTRGDGGQNLIGKEQGVELGLIRTQELLAARKIDGAEQFFTRAYEFGYSKSSDEALRIWDHEKVLSDVVWIIRKFQPDIIITRFPGDIRAGHGHHAASAIIANEAFLAAADSTKFREQFKLGVLPWRAKRILWNTYNFGSLNTTNDSQLKLEVGGYNPILGKSYGEIGAEARTMHKSQGEGRPGRRGAIYEFFETTGGEKPKADIMDGVNTHWSRLGTHEIQTKVSSIIHQYNLENPAASIPSLVELYDKVAKLSNSVWRTYTLDKIQKIVLSSAGIFWEATTQQQQVVPGQKLPIQFFINQRSNCSSLVQKIVLPGMDTIMNIKLQPNQNFQFSYDLSVSNEQPISQPYWLVKPQSEGMFEVDNPLLIGKAENDPVWKAEIFITIAGKPFQFTTPIQYKYVSPTMGDVYQPIVVVPKENYVYEKEIYLARGDEPIEVAFHRIKYDGHLERGMLWMNQQNSELPIPKDAVFTKTIQYDHIPTQTYFPLTKTNIVKVDVKIRGKKVGYFDGAGDKLPEAMMALGYEVVYLKEKDLTLNQLKALDAIVVGIRAYNMHEYLSHQNEILNQYIEQGGNLIVQYLKSNQVGLRKVQVGPYAFNVNASKRVTQEDALVTFTLPNHSVLNFPNPINQNDFAHWVQERSTYQAENVDAHFSMPLRMNDQGEPSSNGSLLIAPYGRGNMVYLSLALFRQLPAGTPGAFKLLANLISLPQNKSIK